MASAASVGSVSLMCAGDHVALPSQRIPAVLRQYSTAEGWRVIAADDWGCHVTGSTGRLATYVKHTKRHMLM
jgi:hypothetical protein